VTADPASTDAAAKRDGMPPMERLRALRSTFGLSLADAKAVVDANDGRAPSFPVIENADQLVAVLTKEFGYCRCASGAALAVLRDLLNAVRKRSDAIRDQVAFSQASRGLEALIDHGGGWAEWVIYILDQRGFVSHGFRQIDLWITDNGRRLLKAIEQYGDEADK
jgi:hypothetical protein